MSNRIYTKTNYLIIEDDATADVYEYPLTTTAYKFTAGNFVIKAKGVGTFTIPSVDVALGEWFPEVGAIALSAQDFLDLLQQNTAR